MLLQRQLADLIKHPVEGFSAGLTDEEDIFKWEVRPLSYRPLSCRPFHSVYPSGCQPSVIHSIRPDVGRFSFILPVRLSAVYHSFYPPVVGHFSFIFLSGFLPAWLLAVYQAFCLRGCQPPVRLLPAQPSVSRFVWPLSGIHEAGLTAFC